MMTDPAPTAEARPKRRWWRIALAAAGICVVGAVTGLHLPFVRSRVLSLVADRLDQQGIHLEADRLGYNLLTLTVELDGVSVAARGVDPPFLEIDAARINLPWSIVTGTLAAESVELTRPRLTLVRAADGSLNLPSTDPDTSGGGLEGPIHIGRLLVSDLAVSYDDATNDQSIRADGLTLDMVSSATGPLAGTLRMAQPAAIQLGQRSTSLDTLAGELTFDGVRLDIGSLDIGAPEGTLHLEGTVDALGRTPKVDARYAARLDAARGAGWSDLDPAPTGTVVLAGTVAGDRDAPDVTAVVDTDDVRWSTLGPITVHAQTALSGSTATIDELRVGVAGGELTADGQVQIDGDGGSALNARWTSLDLAHLSTLAPDLAVRPGAVSDGTLEMTWSGADVLGGRARVSTTLRALGPRAGVLPLAGRLEVTTDNGRWTLVGTPRVADAIEVNARASGQLDEDLDAAPLAGDATITVTDLATAIARLEAAGLVPDLGDGGVVAGSASVAVRLGGTLGVPRATGSIEGAGLRFADAGPATLAARFDASPRTVQVDDLRMDLGTNHVIAQMSIGLEANTIAGTFDAQLPDLATLAAGLPEEWRPEGGATISAVLSGALDNPTADLEISSAGVAMAGQTIDTVASEVHLVNRVATVTSLVLTQQDGRLAASGSYALDGGRYAFTASGTGIVVAPVLTPGTETNGDGAVQADAGAAAEPTPGTSIPIHTRVDLQLQGEGTIDAPQASGQLQFAHVDWGDYQIGSATADIDVADGRASVRAQLPAVKGSVDATIELESGHVVATATLADAELAALARASGPAGTTPADADAETAGIEINGTPMPLTGTLRLTATADGPMRDPSAMAVGSRWVWQTPPSTACPCVPIDPRASTRRTACPSRRHRDSHRGRRIERTRAHRRRIDRIRWPRGVADRRAWRLRAAAPAGCPAWKRRRWPARSICRCARSAHSRHLT